MVLLISDDRNSSKYITKYSPILKYLINIYKGANKGNLRSIVGINMLGICKEHVRDT